MPKYYCVNCGRGFSSVRDLASRNLIGMDSTGNIIHTLRWFEHIRLDPKIVYWLDWRRFYPRRWHLPPSQYP